ncbi:futalosine hydrolase [Paenibacillus sp. YPG26]|uniref:futalosine hydrolase n=1 Tax=Paenibacillus sp. YPG26 TaxID=2878915 RepID=UPI00203CB3AA|nr:futalosine hydrolase [Paenibacillus sp. YPG26]USB31869.1 futalosine hydrolase [Paenibacillus sp. YPG26]
MNHNYTLNIPVIRRVLIMTAVPAEQEAVLRGLLGSPDGAAFDVRLAGVGSAAAAASTARILATAGDCYDLVISAGIGGGFPGRAEIGTVAVASEIIAADLGAESQEGFISVDELGFGSSRIPVQAELAARWTEALQVAGVPVQSGPIVTVTTATGTLATAAGIAGRVPGAAAEAMEGFGAATAAAQAGLPVLEIRGISNRVGPRDRSAWRIGDALAALEAAFTHLQEVLK